MNRLFINKEWSPLKKLLFMNAASGGSLSEYTATGNPVSFNTNVSKPLKQLLIPFSPVQEGSGDPSPENVRPITGRTGLTAYSTGETLIDSTIRTENSSTRIALGGRYGDYDIPLNAGTYTLAIGYNSPDSYNVYYKGPSDSSGVKIKSASTMQAPYVQSVTFTLENTEGYYFWVYRSDENGGVQNSNISWFTLVEGSEPLIPTTIPVTFPSEAGTVYGGTLDLTTDVLTVDTGYIASYNGETLSGKWVSDRDVYSSGSSPTIGAEVAYELAEPLEFQLTPQQITTLIGDNTVWTDTNGENTIKYLKKG